MSDEELARMLQEEEDEAADEPAPTSTTTSSSSTPSTTPGSTVYLASVLFVVNHCTQVPFCIFFNFASNEIVIILTYLFLCISIEFR